MEYSALKYMIGRVIDNGMDAREEARKHPEDPFFQGKLLAYYEVLDTMKNELYLEDQDLREFGLDMNLEREFLSAEYECGRDVVEEFLRSHPDDFDISGYI